ncbi:uncharacterized protein BDR25DRAFT_349190 [Lindgomyces ingoldianus]|uniref:Uncharacterized protein n=1 Tax=Lindgomyces ingoldianus TaxID=673940 RepID=A0ACB6RD22_9PLEO|nr:uncharacterized protein BDR25DRAFT_349190 [Lindgomyces ingoldianus]KAF2477243.1 hypothetical protein BDR25DRAFT_349190 [Lindgomyces ingoldianus]
MHELAAGELGTQLNAGFLEEAWPFVVCLPLLGMYNQKNSRLFENVGFPTCIEGWYLHFLSDADARLALALLDEWKTWFESNEPASTDTSEAEQQLDVDRCNLAGKRFLQLLVQLRIILLQDSVFLQEKFPTHPLWRDPIFNPGVLKPGHLARISVLWVLDLLVVEIRYEPVGFAQGRLSLAQPLLCFSV